MNPIEIETIRHPHEKTAFFWLALAALNFLLVMAITVIGIALVFCIAIGSLLANLWAAAIIRTNGIRVSSDQYPEIYELFERQKERLALSQPPEVYVIQKRIMHAFAAKAAGRNYIVLYSDLVEALLQEGNKEQLVMILGHELGHLAASHVPWRCFLKYGFWVPFLYSYYFRCCEYTADRVGLLCCENLESAKQGLLKLMAGKYLGPRTNLAALEKQRQDGNDSFGVRLTRLLSNKPQMVERIRALDDYSAHLPRGLSSDKGSSLEAEVTV